MLGHAGGKPSMSFPPGTGEILLDNVQCKGNEKHIKECKASGDSGMYMYHYMNCRHQTDFGVICEGMFIFPFVKQNIRKFVNYFKLTPWPFTSKVNNISTTFTCTV
jgi:hypothetical protein